MGTALTVALNLLLVGSFVLFLAALFLAVYRTDDPIEKGIRALAMFVGALIVLATQAAETNYTDFIVDSLGGVRPISFGLGGVIVPGALGATLAWYFAHATKRSPNRAMRVMAMLGTLAGTQFLWLYGASLEEAGFEFNAAMMPNLSFVAGISLYLIFEFNTDDARSSVLSGIAQTIRERTASSNSGDGHPLG